MSTTTTSEQFWSAVDADFDRLDQATSEETEMTTSIAAADLTVGTLIHRAGQMYLVTAIGENAFDEMIADVECVSGNIGQTDTWTLDDPDERFDVSPFDA